MSLQKWVEPLIAANVPSVAMAVAGPATILPPQAVYTMGQGAIEFIGKTLRITAAGVISNIITTPGLLTLDIRFGAVIAWTSSAMQLNAVAKAGVGWWFEFLGTCRTLGTGAAEPTAQLIGIGKFTSESIVGSPLPAVGGAGVLVEPAGPGTLGTVFDSTAANAVNLFATFTIGGTGNSIQTHIYVLEALN
jgi:hypothetical protein